MRRRGAARMPRGVMRNPKLREAVKPGRQQRAAPNINVMRFRCDEPKAKLRRGFSCGKSRLFRGGCVTARDAAVATEWRQNFRRFATRR
jgi:hypothetical protein